MADPEIIDISDLGSNELGMSKDSDLKSTNFGPGIELLMNERKSKSTSPSHEVSNDNDIVDLEKELNDLTETIDLSSLPVMDSRPSVEFSLPTPQLETVDLGEETSRNLARKI